MSLLIKGMEMPKHAIKNGTDDTLYRSCVIVHPDGTAELIIDSTFADMFGFEHNLNRFPLIEIPTPHGRLIDADELIKQYSVSGEEALEMMAENMKAFRMTYELAKRIRDQINQAPTIIEAEE